MAIVLAGGTTYFLFWQLRPSGGNRKMVQIVAAGRDLPAGSTLSVKDLTMLDWPGDVPLPGSFPKTDSVVGRPLIYSLGAHEPILERDLAVAGSGIGLSAKIPPGMRATAVRSNEVVGVAGFLYPGSRVDVLATYNQAGGAGSVTQTILQDVEVLTAGQAIEPDPQGKPQTVNVVTLLLTPEDSQRLLLTSSQGSIQFVLRSGADQNKVQLTPTRMDQLLGNPRPPVVSGPLQKVVPKPELPPRPPAVYVLEVIQGNQRSLHKFEERQPSAPVKDAK